MLRLRAVCLALFVICAQSSLIQQVWPSSGFSPLSAAITTEISALSITNSTDFPALCSVRFTGTIVDVSAAELLNFSVVSDGGVRLWVDDYLVVDFGGNRTTGSPQRFLSFLEVPFSLGEPRPFRLEYSRWGNLGPATLQLWWSGNTTSLSEVPGTAFAPNSSSFLTQRAALRDRLEAPSMPWQTYYFHNMGAHVMMPAGMALSSSLALAGGAASLGGISVFRNGNPALVRPGLRSLDGSDYTLLTISQWTKAPNATITFETTVLGKDGLVFLASCTGSDCSALSLVVQPLMMAERAGSFWGSADNKTLHADLPGYGSVTVLALGVSAATVDSSSAVPVLSLPLGLGYPVGYFASASGATPPSLQAAQDAIATAAVACAAAQTAAYGPLAPLWEGLSSALAWNTMFTPYEGVVTPVSRNWDIWGVGYILFEWDTYFLALMASLQGGRSKDLAYANLIQVTLGRTLMGFVPNGAAGPKKAYDRSEPQVGAQITRSIYKKWGDDWLLEGLMPVFLSWQDWEWNRRRGEGVFAGVDGYADLLALGSDPSFPRSDIQCNLQAARYEGMDNSPLYDSPPAAYNSTSHHMNMYDVGQTAYFAGDVEATIALCQALGDAAPCASSLPILSQRLARVQAAMNAHMWDQEAGMYFNVLFNGTAIRRYAPTNVMPLLSGTPSDAQAAALVASIASPRGFCYNASHTPAPHADMLVQWKTRSGRPSACLSSECTRDVINSNHHFASVEALALLREGGPGPGLLPLNLFVEDVNPGNTALLEGATPPAPGFSLLRQEGWCWDSQSALPPSWPATTLSFWYSPSSSAYKTCGTPVCEADTAPDWQLVRGQMCFALNGTGVLNLPCKVGGASIAREDEAFMDQAYWRGRAWAPHHMLFYWALERYDHLPSARQARLDLVAMGQKMHLFNWDNFGQVCENTHGILGTCEDSGNADPFYHWGALYGFTAFIESGLFS